MVGRLTALTLVLGCHVGRPPTLLDAARAGQVTLHTAEPDLADALSGALSSALAARGVSFGGPPIEMTVVSAQTGTVAAGASQRVEEAQLAVAFELTGHRPRRIVLSGQRSFVVDVTAPLAASDARAAAFGKLAEQLAADAVEWFLYAPSEPPRPAL